MKTPHYLLVTMVLSMQLLMGCQKNQDFVEITKTPIELFFRLSVANEVIEENGYGVICTSQGQEVIIVSNKQELLTTEINPDDLISGDFILFRQIENASETYACLYVLEYTSDGNQIIELFSDSPTTLDSFNLDGNLVTGSHVGTMNSSGGMEVPYSFSFSCGLTTNSDICD
jgi:hypothetical protein